jgi:hypothetical protein
MDHAEARELLELAAVEPGGLERLTRASGAARGDLARHLAECADCSAELDALQREAAAIRDVIRTSPPADLRDRTLTYVAELGRPRSAPVPTPAPVAPTARAGFLDWLRGLARPGSSLGWAASLAAVVVLSVVGSTLIVGGRLDSQLADANAAIQEQDRAIAGLTMLSDWTLRLSADAEAGRVRLASVSGDATTGTAMFSGDTRELVMVASGLSLPPAGSQYRCWIQADGERVLIGQMYFAGDLAYWVGEVDALDGVSDATFGVSLVDASSDGLEGPVVLQGES